MAASMGSKRAGSSIRHLEIDKLKALLAESQKSRQESSVERPAKKAPTLSASTVNASEAASARGKRSAATTKVGTPDEPQARPSKKKKLPDEPQVRQSKKKKLARRRDAEKPLGNAPVEQPAQAQRVTARETSRVEIGALKDRLEAGRFRYLNELLYTVPSQTALQLFQSDPTSFLVYHKGYKLQTEKWPSSPLNKVVAYVKQKASKLVIADMGCGDATLAASVPNKVFSFDLFAVNDRVTVADIARVPVKDKQVDIVIFCLSLMGTNFVEFLLEANRILKTGGHMKIMEIVSRFEGKLRPFTNLVEKLGFVQRKLDISNSHFVDLEFQKVRDHAALAATPEFRLQPCLYKKR